MYLSVSSNNYPCLGVQVSQYVPLTRSIGVQCELLPLPVLSHEKETDNVTSAESIYDDDNTSTDPDKSSSYQATESDEESYR